MKAFPVRRGHRMLSASDRPTRRVVALKYDRLLHLMLAVLLHIHMLDG